jgi:hypothetical protein
MSDYHLTSTQRVIRTADGAWITVAPGAHDWEEYQAWVADGGVPDPYVPPEPVPPEPTAEQEILFDHENRVRALEGQPPLELGDFLQKMLR